MKLFGKKDGKDEEAIDGIDLDEGPGDEATPPAKSRKGLLLSLLVAGGAVAGGYYYLSSELGDVAVAPRPPQVAVTAPVVRPVVAPIVPSPYDITAGPALPLTAVVQTSVPPAPVVAAVQPPEESKIKTPSADAIADLPVPAGAEVMSLPATAVVVSDNPPPLHGGDKLPVSVPETEQQEKSLSLKSAASGLSEAERALVENAPMLENLSHQNVPPSAHAGAEIPQPVEIEAQNALIRVLPEKYVVVKKNRNAGDIDSRLTAARSALAENRNQAALAIFSDMEKTNPHDSRVLMGKAIALQSLGQNDEALAAYEDVLGQEPKNVEALTNMLGLLKAQDPHLALNKLKELRDDYPSSADITAQLGISYGVMGDYSSALKYLDMAEALGPGNAFVIYNRAVVYDKMGDSVHAAEYYRKILSLAAEGGLSQQLPLDAIRSRLVALR
jgi:Flp pilus assembly protein TadD